jgi:RNA polymerase sigma-70 factor (ECF subfamily)
MSAAALRLVPARESTDREWVQRIRAGDTAAFEHIFRTYFGPLCAIANGYVRSPDVAEELVQDLLLAVWGRRAELDLRENLRVYLFRAARNRAHNHLRRGRREISWGRDAAASRLPSPLPGAAETVESRELVAAIEAAIAGLPERRRLAFQLTQQVGLSHLEAAAVMSIAPKTVAIHLGLARQELRSRLRAFINP